MERVITDEAGRSLTLRKVGVLETLRLYKALGPNLSANESYMSLVVSAAAVSMVDGVPLPFPINEAGVEAMFERIGDAAMTAVVAAVRPATPAEVVAQAGN